MRTLGIALFIIIAASALPAVAQEKVAKPQATTVATTIAVPERSVSMPAQLCTLPTGSMPITPEMWFYEQQLREYLNPKMAVRRNAEFKANQRRHRLAAMRWFGFSNLRPTASPDPWNGDYSPGWVGGSELHPERWSGAGWSAIITCPR